jgi:hypothetical protein
MELFFMLLPFSGLGAGFVAIAFGAVALASGELIFTRHRVLRGAIARGVGIACILLGTAVIGYVMLMVRLFPDGLGH